MGCKNKCKFSIGSLNIKITLQTRKINEWATNDNGEPRYTFTDVATVWAGLEIKSPYTVIDGIGQDAKYTHKFTIRHLDNVTNELFILYNGNRYKIDNFKNIGEEDRYHKFIVLYANISGAKDLLGSE